MDILTLMTNLSSSYKPIYGLMMNFCFIAGFGMIIFGLNQFRPTEGNDNSRSPRVGFWTVLVGALLIYLPSAIDMVSLTVFALDSQKPEFAYSQDASVESTPLIAIRYFLQLFGTFTFIRGLFVLRAISSLGRHAPNGKDNNYAAAAVLIISGMLLINIDRLAGTMAASFGLNSAAGLL